MRQRAVLDLPPWRFEVRQGLTARLDLTPRWLQSDTESSEPESWPCSTACVGLNKGSVPRVFGLRFLKAI